MHIYIGIYIRRYVRGNKYVTRWTLASVQLEQGSATYGSRVRYCSFDDCIWLADKIVAKIS